MILVDVNIPAIDDTYDFMLDETVSVEKIIMEIAEMVAKRTKSPLERGAGEFMLYSMDEKTLLKNVRTLWENGIRDGSRLMLV